MKLSIVDFIHLVGPENGDLKLKIIFIDSKEKKIIEETFAEDNDFIIDSNNHSMTFNNISDFRKMMSHNVEMQDFFAKQYICMFTFSEGTLTIQNI